MRTAPRDTTTTHSARSFKEWTFIDARRTGSHPCRECLGPPHLSRRRRLLIITGGRFDIDPSLYGQTARQSYVTKPVRTAFEKALIERSIPVLGICNGMQLLAACLGGRLVQDILSGVVGAFEHKPGPSAALPHHEIDISSNRIGIAAGRYPVNSNHHHAVLPSDAYKETHRTSMQTALVSASETWKQARVIVHGSSVCEGVELLCSGQEVGCTDARLKVCHS